MDLVIETLTGTVFELRVSPFETIMSVKAKIQRLEGIPMSQQHLIWQSLELEDDYCLHDYNIQDGTTLKLVLAMRGGPINTRRVSLEDPTIREMAEYMEANRDDIWESLMKDNRQVTLLVFRDGDQLNFFRVYDRGDGTLTPMSDTLSAASMYNMYDEGEDVAEMAVERDKENGETKAKMETLREEMTNLSLRRKEKEKENQQTKVKMELLRKQMARLNIKKKPVLNPRPPSTEKPSNNLARRRLKFAERMTYQRHRQQKETSKENMTDPTSLSERDEDKKSLPPVSLHRRLTDDVNIADILATRNRDMKIVQELNPPARHPSDIGRVDTDNTNMSERLKRRTNNSRQIAGRRPLVRNHGGGELCPDETTIAESEEELHVASDVNESRLGNGSTSSRILRDLMMRNPSAEEHEVGSIDYRKSPIEGESNSPEEQEDGRSLGQLWRGSKEYRDYRALISWIRPRSSAKQHSPTRGGSRVRFEAEVERGGSGRIVNDLGHVSRSRITPEDFTGPMPLPPKLPVTKRSTSGRDSTYALPPVSGKKRPPQLLATGRKKTRCSQCAKKLGLATSYQCRCGNVFCATHRYAETHSCTYDYKAEGKKMLEQSNPLVIAPKLPKI